MDSFSDSPTVTSSQSGRLHKTAYYSLLATTFLAPLAFLTTPYLALDLAKSFVITIGTLVTAVCYALIYIKEKRVEAPPKTVFWSSILILLSLIVSSFTSIHASKSLFGQGFEITTASFMAILFVAGWVTFEVVHRNKDRAFTILTSVVAAFALLWLIHAIRIVAPSFLSGASLNSATATILGKWNDLAIYSVVLAIIAAAGVVTNAFPKRIRTILMVIGVLAVLTAGYINHTTTWIAAAITFGIWAVAAFVKNEREPGKGILSRVSWIPTALFVVSILLTFYGANVFGRIITKTGTAYSELSLPWQMTLDVVSGSIKNYPWFGVGPNHFSQAFMTYKPNVFNLTDAWSAEFNTGFGLIPTLIASVGLIGGLFWVLFFVFMGIILVRSWKRMPSDPRGRFVLLATSSASVFLWIETITYVPSHALVYLTFVMSGIALAYAVSAGAAETYVIGAEGSKQRSFLPGLTVAMLVVFIVWGLMIAKKTVALAYFATGVKDISVGQKFDDADKAFRSALAFDKSDVYWQAISENARLKATSLIQTATTNSPTLVTQVTSVIDSGTAAANAAVAYDPTNYYNYVSQARIAQVAASLKMEKGYDTAVAAYTAAIQHNPLNPALYVALAQLQAANGSYDAALQTLGAALQVKNNYLDAVYLVSQIQAAKGDLGSAITAAQVAIQLQPQNPLLYFQLGLLQYNNKSYAAAEDAFGKAVQYQPDYANAKYFLGLSEARIGNNSKAIELFTDLSKANPDNKDVATILGALKSGRSPFVAAQTAPQQTLPVKETTKSTTATH